MLLKTYLIMQVFENSTVSDCGIATDVIADGIIQHFYRKNDFQLKLIEMQQHSNEAVETVAHYIKGTLENQVFFFNM